MKSIYLAGDLGGTKMAAALIATGGQILARNVRPTPAGQGIDHVVDEFAGLLLEVAAQYASDPLAACGLAVPGLVDASEGVIRYAANLDGARDYPLRQRMESRLGMPVAMDNDLRLHALGESLYGAAAGCRHFLFVGVGTGVGGALFLSGELYRGARGHAGEIGHISIDPTPDALQCTCGLRGCLEAYASGPAIAADFVRRAARAGLNLDGEAITLKEMAPWLVIDDRRGELARLAVAAGAEALGRGLSIAANLLDPQRIILGGGVANLGALWLEGVRRAYARMAFARGAFAPMAFAGVASSSQDQIAIQLSSLGGDAPLLGAAVLAGGGILH